MTVEIIQGDCRVSMAAMPEKSVNCIVTSPPYWGLRDYGTAPLSWPAMTYSPLPGLPPCVEIPAMDACLGLEPTLEAFIGHMILVFREAWRVLRDDGTAWVNMGDSYAGSRCGGHTEASGLRNPGQKIDESSRAKSMTASRRRDNEPIPRSDLRIPGLKAKDMVGQPWRLAFALQADGWYLRSDIIWSKPSPMPESTKDRPTKAHEYFFLLSKNGSKPLLWRAEDTMEWVYSKPDLTQTIPAPTSQNPGATKPRWKGCDYYYDHEAIKEPASEDTHARYARGRSTNHKNAQLEIVPGHRPQTIAQGFEHMRGVGFGHGTDAEARGRGRVKPVSGWDTGPGSHSVLEFNQPAPGPKEGADGNDSAYGDGKSSRMGRGAGWRQNPKAAAADSGIKANESFQAATASVLEYRAKRSVWHVASEGFPGAHFATFPTKLIEPCILAGCPEGGKVLDLFAGSATTGLVADRLGRDAVLCELSADYIAIGERRLAGDAGHIKRQRSLIGDAA